MESVVPIYNTMLYLVNKAVFQLFGENSRALSRMAAKYIVDYLHSQNIIDKNNLNEESVKKAFIEDLGVCEDLIYSEEDGQAILKIVNPALREGIVELGKENLPVIIAPGIIYGYLINDIRNHKASYQEQSYDKESNTTIVKFKIMS
ncbi:MAG: hypothetical protein PQ975_11605 [Methanobacterium sp.]|jgi:hypothetical protein